MEISNKLVTVGRINKPHGIKGEIELTVLTDYPERFKKGSTFHLDPPLPSISKVSVENVRKKKNVLLIKFKDVDDRTGADDLSGKEVAVTVDELAELGDDEYWHFDLVGMRVMTNDGRELGTLIEVLTGRANDVYVVRDGDEHLIPATAEVIEKVDIENKTMVINPIPGLLD